MCVLRGYTSRATPTLHSLSRSNGLQSGLKSPNDGGWNHDFQWSLHLQRFTDRCFFRTSFNDRAIGTVALTEVPGHVRLDEFYLLPEVQRRGLGTRILRHILAHTDKAGLPVAPAPPVESGWLALPPARLYPRWRD